MIFALDDYRLDPDRRELRHGRDVIELEPQVFDLLVFLVSHRSRVVSKSDILQTLWRGKVVSDSTLHTRIHAARRALGDDGNAQRVIRTFPRKGVRFVGDVREIREPCGTPDFRVTQSAPQALPLRPTIAVLPFSNLGGDTRQAHLAHAMTEQVAAALSRIHWLVVISQDRDLECRDRIPGRQRVPIDSDIRYVLAGSVQQCGNIVRAAARLIDAESGAYLWAEHFDGRIETAFGLQDETAAGIAGGVEPVLQSLEAARTLDCPDQHLVAYHAYLRAFSILLTAARRVPEALAILEDALVADPDCGQALGLAANCCMRLCMDGVSTNPAADVRKSTDYAWRALEADPDDPGVLANVARPLAYGGENIDMTVRLMDRALALNPNSARGWYIRGFLKYWAGDSRTAIKEVETARRLSPRGRFGTPLTVIGNALLFSERIDEAIPKLKTAIQDDPSFPPNYRLLAICYAHSGRLGEARATIASLPDTAPLVLSNIARSYRAMFREPQQREFALKGIQLATGERV